MREFDIIDCHNHSLPYVDDGAESLDMALEMLKIAELNGTTDIALTPHHLNGAFLNHRDSVIDQVYALKEEAKKREISLNLHLGSEVHLVTETAEQLISQKALTYCGLGKAALIELPKSSIPNGVERILSELVFNGISPIIAHPERNSSLRKDHTPLQEWVEFGCKAQLTGQSCTGDFGIGLQEVSFKMIEHGLIHLVASDAHRPTGRSPDLSKAADVLIESYGSKAAKLLLHDNPKRILRGEELKSLVVERFKNTLSSDQARADNMKNRSKTSRRKKTLLQRLIDFK